MNNELPPILRVDDDPTDLFLFQRAVRTAGIPHPVKIARNGVEAIDYLAGRAPFENRAHYPLPCLVLLDLNMPRCNGFEVLAWRRYQPCVRQIPVVMLTGSGLPWDVSAAYEAGANGYLVKPSDFNGLVEMAKAIAAFWLNHNTFADLDLDPAAPPLERVQPEIPSIPCLALATIGRSAAE